MIGILDYLLNPERFFIDINRKKNNWRILFLAIFFGILIHIGGNLIIAWKNFKIIESSLEQIQNLPSLNSFFFYSISVIASLNVWIIIFLYLPFSICFDITCGGKEDYLVFIKTSIYSFLGVIPYAIILTILSLFYNPTDLQGAGGIEKDQLIDWAFQASKLISSSKIGLLINKLNSIMTIWIIGVITISFKAAYKKSAKRCYLLAALYLFIILMV